LVELKNAKKVIAIKKNAAELKEVGSSAQVTNYPVLLNDSDFNTKTLSTEKLPRYFTSRAEIVVSGGRGMKGPEHWEFLSLAKALHAATGCSKPVSDMVGVRTIARGQMELRLLLSFISQWHLWCNTTFSGGNSSKCML